MAIELHHLNTHGMMEQACNVLDGVVRLKERIAELESSIDKEKAWSETLSKNGVTMSHEIERLKAENERMKARIAELEKENESLKYSVATLETDLAMSKRWRECSKDMPSADEGYFFALWEDKVPDIGYIGAEDDVIETIRDRGEGHSVEWWMPMPSAPNEEK